MLGQPSTCPQTGLRNEPKRSEKRAEIGTANWTPYLFMVLLTIVFSSIGLIVSNYSETMQQAMLVMWFIMVCTMLLSALFTPVRSMPNWAQTLTWFLPVRHYIDATRSVFIRGTSLNGLTTQLAILASMATIMGAWAVWSYKKNS